MPDWLRRTAPGDVSCGGEEAADVQADREWMLSAVHWFTQEDPLQGHLARPPPKTRLSTYWWLVWMGVQHKNNNTWETQKKAEKPI